MINFFKNNLLWQDGKYIALTIKLLAILAFIFFKPFLIVIAGFFLFTLYFFRNPNRKCKEFKKDSSVFISPADGKVVDVAHGDFEGYSKKISIFLSPLDVHVNWLPQEGTVTKVNYRPGKFLVAYAPKSSTLNERNDIIIKCKNDQEILVRQIAGIVARRICCWVKEGEMVRGGEKFGMIRFGSRVDVLMPANVQINVQVGDKLKGGQSILGKWL